MSNQEKGIFQPCHPDDFYGLRDTITSFTKLAEKNRTQDTTKVHSVLIIGHEGTGKSSLLKKLSTSLTNRKDIAYIFEVHPEEQELLDLFKNWKNKIDEFSPEWRSMLEKVGRKQLGDDLPAIREQIKKQANQSYTEVYVSLFLENLEKVDQKLKETDNYLYFFFDNLQLFKFMDIQEFFPIYSTIIKEIVNKEYNIIVVSAFDERFLYDFDYEKNLTENSTIFQVETLSVSESEIYLRRKAPALVNKGLLELVNISQRSFFDLNLGVYFIESNHEIQEFVERNIPALFGLSEDEENALAEMSTYNENLFLIEQLTAYVPLEALKQLEEKGLIWMGTTHARLVQESLLTAFKFRMRLFSPLTTLMVSLDSILEDLGKFIAPTEKTITNVGVLSAKVRDRLADFAVAAKIQKIVNICIQRKIYQKAYDLTLINTQQFENINELEQAGGFCEKIAREFEEKNFYFAARLYLKSAEYYTAVEEELKAKRSYARAADQFEKLALSLPIETSKYAVRGYLKSCLNCYHSMGDKDNFERIRRKATEMYEKDSIHHNYFIQMKYKEEKEEKMITLPEAEEKIEPDTVEEISIESIEKELDF